MSTQGDILRTRVAPEFASKTSFSDGLVDGFLTDAVERMGPASVWGNVYLAAVRYLAAHLMTEVYPNAPSTMPTSGNIAGPVSSRKTGDLAETYSASMLANLSLTEAALASTKHGRSYIGLRNSRAIVAPSYVQ